MSTEKEIEVALQEFESDLRSMYGMTESEIQEQLEKFKEELAVDFAIEEFSEPTTTTTSKPDIRSWIGKEVICIDDSRTRDFTKGKHYMCTNANKERSKIYLEGDDGSTWEMDSCRFRLKEEPITVENLLSDLTLEAICIDNKDIEDQFDIGVSYLVNRVFPYAGEDDLVQVENADGKLVTLFRTRFKFV